MTTLMQAHTQWAKRPADQRFESLDALHAHVEHLRMAAVEAPSVPVAALHVEQDDADIRLVGPTGTDAGFTHWSFGQISRYAKAPAAYMRALPPHLAVQCLNDGLGKAAEDETTKLLFQQNGDLICTGATGDGYVRIWHHDITGRLKTLRDFGWQEAPPAFDGSRGMYAGDEDMFCFMVDNDRRIFESLPGGGLSRGFFVWNSVVGAASFGIMTFWYNYICGNHMVWGAEGVKELRIPHIGNADGRVFEALAGELREYRDTAASSDEMKIERAMTTILGNDKDEVLDKVFGLRLNGLTRTLIGAAYDKAVEHEDWYGNPRSVWGLTSGMTEIARDLPNANDRTALDRLAGKVMQVAF